MAPGSYRACPFVQDLPECIERERLDQHVVHARLETAPALLRHGAGRDGHNRSSRPPVAAFNGANCSRGLKSVHAGHVEVHEDDVEALAARGGDGRNAIEDDLHTAVEVAQRRLGERSVGVVVFGEQ